MNVTKGYIHRDVGRYHKVKAPVTRAQVTLSKSIVEVMLWGNPTTVIMEVDELTGELTVWNINDYKKNG